MYRLKFCVISRVRPIPVATLGLCLILTIGVAGRSVGAPIGEHPSRTRTRQAIVLDQRGLKIAQPSGNSNSPQPQFLASGRFPTYVAYKANGSEIRDKSIPTIQGSNSGSLPNRNALHLNALALQKLNEALNHSTKVNLHNRMANYIVQRVVPSTSTTTSSPAGNGIPQAQTLTPPNGDSTTPQKDPGTPNKSTLDDVANARFLQPIKLDFNLKNGNLLTTLKQATIDNFLNQLHIKSPTNVSTTPIATKSSGSQTAPHAAELLTPAGNVTISPAPVPEPGTILIFGIAIGGMGLLRRRDRRGRASASRKRGDVDWAKGGHVQRDDVRRPPGPLPMDRHDACQ